MAGHAMHCFLLGGERGHSSPFSLLHSSFPTFFSPFFAPFSFHPFFFFLLSSCTYIFE